VIIPLSIIPQQIGTCTIFHQQPIVIHLSTRLQIVTTISPHRCLCLRNHSCPCAQWYNLAKLVLLNKLHFYVITITFSVNKLHCNTLIISLHTFTSQLHKQHTEHQKSLYTSGSILWLLLTDKHEHKLTEGKTRIETYVKINHAEQDVARSQTGL